MITMHIKNKNNFRPPTVTQDPTFIPHKGDKIKDNNGIFEVIDVCCEMEGDNTTIWIVTDIA